MTHKIALPFSDDSTLFFASQIRDLLRQIPQPPQIETVFYTTENALSPRQLKTHLPAGPDLTLTGAEMAEHLFDHVWDAVITSRMYRPLNTFLCDAAQQDRADRTCVIAFLGGLDFFPEEGFYNRRFSDAVYLFPRNRIPMFQATAKAWDTVPKDIAFGHPAAIQTRIEAPDLGDRSDIYFFAQALSPLTRRGRMHILAMLRAIALAHPDRTVWIKLRHLPDENRKHKHQEAYDYSSLMHQMSGPQPPNLRLTACTMQEALDGAAIGITCTSTAAIDLIRAGLPTMVYLDYVDYYADPLVEPMRTLFTGSNLIKSLDDILALQTSPPTAQWRDDMFCPDDLGPRILDSIAKFQAARGKE